MSEVTLLILIGVLVLCAVSFALVLAVALGAAAAREDARQDRQLPVAESLIRAAKAAAPAEDHAGARLCPGNGVRAATAHRGGAAPPAPIPSSKTTRLPPWPVPL